MKLYELERGSVITGVECKDKDGNVLGESITFHHLDGMYSYCTVEDKEGKSHPVHLSAGTELTKNEDGTYKINV